MLHKARSTLIKRIKRQHSFAVMATITVSSRPILFTFSFKLSYILRATQSPLRLNSFERLGKGKGKRGFV